MSSVEYTILQVNMLRTEAHALRRQWITWLGVGSAGGIVALLSFAANLPDPDHALRTLFPSIAAFVIAIILAGPAILTTASETAAAAEHFSEASNQDQYQQLVAKTPEFIASPPAMADRMNAKRNSLKSRGEEHRKIADDAWQSRERMRRLGFGLTSLAALSFVGGLVFPLYIVSAGVPLAPAEMPSQTKAALPVQHEKAH